MIPLMYIQKKDNLLAKTTAAITRMRAHYRHLRRAIEVSFEMNLEDNFSLMIELNEFDEPNNIYIKTLRNSEYTEVTPDVKEYTIENDREVVVISYETILNIAGNVVTKTEIENIDIKAKMLNPYKDPDVLMTYFSFNDGFITFHVNDQSFNYYEHDLEPILQMGNEFINPSRILGNYYIYDIELDSQPYEIALIHSRAFKHHYLFRQTDSTHQLTLNGNTIYDFYGDSYTFNEGMVNKNNNNISLQSFFDVVYDEEYKQYYFNAMRDNNLYTEIATAFDLTKHHSLNVYNLKTDERLMGKVNVRSEFNSKTVPEIVLEMDKPLDQFFNKTDYNIQFRFPVYNLVHILSSANQNYRLIDYGYFMVNGEFVAVSSNLVNEELFAYVTASNNKWFFSVSEFLLQRVLENITIYLVPMIKNIAPDVFLSSIYNLKEINYALKTVTLNNVFSYEEVGFDDVAQAQGIIAKENNTLFRPDVQKAFGINFNMPPVSIEFNPVTPDIYDEVALLTKMCENDEYLIPDIEANCMNFSRAMRIIIGMKSFILIYNLEKDYVYYLDMTNKTSTKDADGLEDMMTFLTIEDESSLISILKTFSLFTYMVKDKGYGVNVNNDLDVIPYMVYPGLANNTFSSEQGPVKPVTNVGYINRNNKIKAAYNESSNVYKEHFKGIFAKYNTEITNVQIEKDNLLVSTTTDGTKSIFIVKIDSKGIYRCFDIFGNEAKLTYDKNALDTIYGPIAFNDYIAIDMNLVESYITNSDFTINGETSILFKDKALIVQSKKPVSELSKQDDYKYTDTATVALENWFGYEIFGIITTDYLESSKNSPFYCLTNIYKDDNQTIYRINSDVSKYIVKY